ncbi:MAG: hypothetical protein FJ240_01375 [Nitrospira sp.]|nr:hypothetical protein [Nitrospira sp.]
MLTTKDAIEQRRSIGKFKPDPVPDEYIMALLNAARLAPSASSQRFDDYGSDNNFYFIYYAHQFISNC